MLSLATALFPLSALFLSFLSASSSIPFSSILWETTQIDPQCHKTKFKQTISDSTVTLLTLFDVVSETGYKMI